MFRQQPPVEILTQLLQACGLQHVYDTSWFQKEQINLDSFLQTIPILEPYYIPCKAEEYLHKTISHNNCITILRQILRTYNISIVSKELTRNHEKTVWYQLQLSKTSPLTQQQGDVLIEFT
jgi:hypothetical protein